MDAAKGHSEFLFFSSLARGGRDGLSAIDLLLAAPRKKQADF